MLKPHQNVIGRRIAHLRYQRKWTQEVLAAKLQQEGYDISRETVAWIETGRRGVSDELLVGFLKVFHLPFDCFFPPEIQKLSIKYAQQQTNFTP